MADSYWTVSDGLASRTGFSCRECKQVIGKGQPMKVREGRKMRFYYHRQCFSGENMARSGLLTCLYEADFHNCNSFMAAAVLASYLSQAVTYRICTVIPGQNCSGCTYFAGLLSLGSFRC